ncbi:YbdK family carboxylate-amine ligase [Diaminobutyricibacter tongyongensis]|uniref:Putative glutamate--cysteine ligase 2 n=1 Tax=Leifsonia tongyongensis TaxID=1268043 RepID=A0A6L9XVQ7_9MICO|nr:glutamate--cysteine ligase [Diaminobutyricibacter tongyongensis]NEN05509.1 YbdK family carboxylate-amine ligase [Diaminobutyricibacter tongyongensis]
MRTLGVEEELLLVDERTGIPMAVAPQAVADAPDWAASTSGPGVEEEFKEEMLEAQTRPHESAADLFDEIVAGRALADRLVKPYGARAVALAMSPMSFVPHPTREPRYGTMMERYGATARNVLVCGCHVHVGIDSRDEGVAVMDRIRNWLPVILALSANSPFANGDDTGYASYRFAAWHQWQSAGPTEVFGSVAAYEEFERILVATEVILDRRMIYLDARLPHQLPTVEVRIADVCLDPRDTIVLAALIRALVDTAVDEWQHDVAPVAVPAAALRLAEWQAALTGAAGRLPHPEHGRGGTAADAVAALVAHVDRALGANGDRELVRSGLKRMLENGGGAGIQRRAFGVRGSLLDVVTDALRVTHAQEAAGHGTG